MTEGGDTTSRAEQFADLYTEDRIDDQLGFYHRRIAEHEKARDQAIFAKWALSALAAAAGSVGAALPAWRVGLAIAAAFLAAAAAALTAYQSLYAFARLAKLYDDAESSLAALTAGAALHDPALTPEQSRRLVRQVEAIFKQETGHWGQLTRHAAGESAQRTHH